MRSSRAVRALAPAVAAAALGLVVAASAGAGAKADPQVKNGGTLVVGLAEDPDALDPTLARTFVGRIVFLHMCEKLYDLDSKLADRAAARSRAAAGLQGQAHLHDQDPDAGSSSTTARRSTRRRSRPRSIAT